MSGSGQFGAGPVVPPGWYADPVNPNVLRYWTGSAWTDHAAPMPMPTTAGVPLDAAYGRVPGWDLDAAPLGFGEAIVSAYRNIFRYQGRASRSALWWFALFSYLVGVVSDLVGPPASVAGVSIFGGSEGVLSSHDLGFPGWFGSGLPGLVSLALLLPAIALLVRRVHDRDTSGWMAFLFLIPLVGGLILAIMCIKRGTPGPNRFSIQPLGSP